MERDASHQLYAIADERVVRVGESAKGVDLVDAGIRLTGVRRAALSADGQRAVVVSNGELSSVSMSSGRATPILQAGGLLDPEFSRSGEVWVPDGSERLRVVLGKDQFEVGLEGVSGAGIRAVRISPEGSRAALVIRDAAGKQRAGVVLVSRGEGQITLRGWRPLFLAMNESQVEPEVLDIGWSGTDRLIVLVKDAHGSGVITVGSDGASPTSLGR